MKPIEKLQTGQLLNIFFDILVLGVHAKDSRDLGRLESFRTRIEEMFQEADRRGTERQYSRETLNEARYAVVTFFDEMILQSGWDQKSRWASSPLQYQYFQTQVGGEEFFRRLNACVGPIRSMQIFSKSFKPVWYWALKENTNWKAEKN